MIEVANVVKKYGPNTVLNGATFHVAEAQLTTILGPSGCGKSTMLRCLNRLETFDTGRIVIDDVEIAGGMTTSASDDELVQKVRDRVGIVFQNFNLFPHLTALENVIEAPLTVKKLPRAKAEETGRYYLNRVGLSGKESHYPAQLSGGQQQRVAIARALAMEPAVVLFDEPTSALDPRLVHEVATFLRALDDLEKTLIVVSHDLHFARAIADQVIYFEGGRAVEVGPASTVLANPAQPETKAFMDSFNSGSLRERA